MRTARTIITVTMGLLAFSKAGAAQGCEPIRFTTPILGGQGESFQRSHEWRVSLQYRRLFTDEWFVGTRVFNDSAPFGSAPVVSLHTFVGDVTYALSERFSLRFSVPFLTGSMLRKYADLQIHRQTATGIGDVSLGGNFWLLDPLAHRNGNIALGLGVKAPTGNNRVASQFWKATGPVPFTADGSIELGDGGWGFTLDLQAFRQVFDRGYVYLNGSYLFNPRAQTNVEAPRPGDGTFWSVSDVYSARLGAAYTLLPRAGLSVNLGGRIDGTPVHDVFGGGDGAYRRPGQVIYLDPGLAWSHGRDNITLSAPLRLRAERQRSVLETNQTTPVGGGFARLLIFAGYSRRF